MDSAVQYIKDFQGNDILAVLPIEEYRFLRERAIGDEEEEIPEAHKHILDERIEKYKNSRVLYTKRYKIAIHYVIFEETKTVLVYAFLHQKEDSTKILNRII